MSGAPTDIRLAPGNVTFVKRSGDSARTVTMGNYPDADAEAEGTMTIRLSPEPSDDPTAPTRDNRFTKRPRVQWRAHLRRNCFPAPNVNHLATKVAAIVYLPDLLG